MSASMTGYGRGEAADGERRVIVEIKSVNNRYCDIQTRLPRSLAGLESRVREQIGQRVTRGKIDVFISIDDHSSDAGRVHCDLGLAHAYADALRQIAQQENIPDGLNAALIARFNDVIQTEQAEVPLDAVNDLLADALHAALDMLCRMRQTEGARLNEDIRQRTVTLETLRVEIARRAPQVVSAYRTRLFERIRELLGNQAEELVGRERLATEVALFADKCAIDEEIVRLHSHLILLRDTVSLGEPVGKKLDFLVQEINREVNTIGSKANDLDLINQVVAMKSEVEKIREQVQNLE